MCSVKKKNRSKTRIDRGSYTVTIARESSGIPGIIVQPYRDSFVIKCNNLAIISFLYSDTDIISSRERLTG